MKASEIRVEVARLRRIVNRVNEELKRVGSMEIVPDN
jgi:hypothetical protein